MRSVETQDDPASVPPLNGTVDSFTWSIPNVRNRANATSPRASSAAQRFGRYGSALDAVTAAGAGDDIPDETVNAVCGELTDVADKVWSKPFPSDGDRREQYAALLERAEVAHFFNVVRTSKATTPALRRS